MIDPDIKKNPHPIKRYEITMTIDGAPGPFNTVTGKMGYEITNPLCWPQDPVSGARPTPSEDPPIVFARVSDNVYKGIVYLDLLQDEDYYGLGVCHWKMTSANVWLKINRVTFTPSISSEDMLSRKPIKGYFSKISYLDNTSNNFFDSGMPTDNENYAIEHPDQFFLIALSAKEISP